MSFQAIKMAISQRSRQAALCITKINSQMNIQNIFQLVFYTFDTGSLCERLQNNDSQLYIDNIRSFI